MESSFNPEKLVIASILPEADARKTSNDDGGRVWRLSPGEVFNYAQSARVVCRELGLRPLGSTRRGNRARN
jgi:hypothetical protein